MLLKGSNLTRFIELPSLLDQAFMTGDCGIVETWLDGGCDLNAFYTTSRGDGTFRDPVTLLALASMKTNILGSTLPAPRLPATSRVNQAQACG